MSSFRSQFRDIKQWQASTNGNIVLNTQSDEAAKMLDASFEQYCGWYDDDSLGGLATTLDRLVRADPNFVLGRAFDVQLNLLGSLTTPRLDSKLASKIDSFNELAKRKSGSLNEHEKLHVNLVNELAANNLKNAAKCVDELATLYPHDVPALKTGQSLYFYLGQSLPMRNSLAYAIKQLENNNNGDCCRGGASDNPFKGYLHGLMSFAYEESHQFDAGQREALKALALIPHDTWAIHNYAHCLEMQAKHEEGLKWMHDKKPDWSKCQALASHQHWHTALFHINNNQFDDAVCLLDEQVLKRCTNDVSAISLHDATSLVYRMELVDLFSKTANNNQPIKDCNTATNCNNASTRQQSSNNKSKNKWRWTKPYDVCKHHKNEHLVGFNDAHFMMALLGMDDLSGARELIDSIDDSQPDVMPEASAVVRPLLEAMYQFKLGEYAKSTELLNAIRFDIVKIGGSHAQRDVFEQLLLVSALRSDKITHNKFGERMLIERDALQNKRTVQTKLLAQSAL